MKPHQWSLRNLLSPGDLDPEDAVDAMTVEELRSVLRDALALCDAE